MYTTYDGSHSIIIDDIHTWEDWGLVPSSRPVVNPPSVKTNTIEIPGANGVIDLSEIPLGFPTYNNTTGSWDFNVAHDKTGLEWDQTYSLIKSYIHGKRRKVVLTDDKSYYYEGRLSVNQFKSDRYFSKITINYDLHPFKWMIWTTTEDWLWDPFDFVYGEIAQDVFKGIVVDSDSYSGLKTWSSNEIGDVPVTPTFMVESFDGNPISIAVHNLNYGSAQYFDLEDGVTRNPLIMLACPDPTDRTRLMFKGHGKVSIDFRPGRL